MTMNELVGTTWASMFITQTKGALIQHDFSLRRAAIAPPPHTHTHTHDADVMTKSCNMRRSRF